MNTKYTKIPTTINYFWLHVKPNKYNKNHKPSFISYKDYSALKTNVCNFAKNTELDWKFQLWTDSNDLYFMEHYNNKSKLSSISKDGWQIQCSYDNDLAHFSFSSEITIKVNDINEDPNLRASQYLKKFNRDGKYLGIRVDTARYEVGYTYGGILSDLDFVFKDSKMVIDLMYDYNFVATSCGVCCVSISAFAVSPKHPVLKYATDVKLLKEVISITKNIICKDLEGDNIQMARCMASAVTAGSLGLSNYKLRKVDKEEHNLNDLNIMAKEFIRSDSHLESQCKGCQTNMQVHNHIVSSNVFPSELSSYDKEWCFDTRKILIESTEECGDIMGSQVGDGDTWLSNAFS